VVLVVAETEQPVVVRLEALELLIVAVVAVVDTISHRLVMQVVQA
jgi:hypothetical protein